MTVCPAGDRGGSDSWVLRSQFLLFIALSFLSSLPPLLSFLATVLQPSSRIFYRISKRELADGRQERRIASTFQRPTKRAHERSKTRIKVAKQAYYGRHLMGRAATTDIICNMQLSACPSELRKSHTTRTPSLHMNPRTTRIYPVFDYDKTKDWIYEPAEATVRAFPLWAYPIGAAIARRIFYLSSSSRPVIHSN